MDTKSSAFDNATNTIMHSSSSGMFAGTGHNAEIITDDKGKDWMCYHAYWKNNNYNGRCMNMDQVEWGDGWPYFADGELPRARFQARPGRILMSSPSPMALLSWKCLKTSLQDLPESPCRFLRLE